MAAAFPSEAQIHALEMLKQEDNQVIFAQIRLLRSIKPGFQYCSSADGPPSSMVDALSTVRDCPEDRLLQWLDLARAARE